MIPPFSRVLVAQASVTDSPFENNKDHPAWLYVKSQSLTRVCCLHIGQCHGSPSAGRTGFFALGRARSKVEGSIFRNVEPYSHFWQYAIHVGIGQSANQRAWAPASEVRQVSEWVRYGCDTAHQIQTYNACRFKNIQQSPYSLDPPSASRIFRASALGR